MRRKAAPLTRENLRDSQLQRKPAFPQPSDADKRSEFAPLEESVAEKAGVRRRLPREELRRRPNR